MEPWRLLQKQATEALGRAFASKSAADKDRHIERATRLIERAVAADPRGPVAK